MKTDKQKKPAPDKANREPSEPVGKGETAHPSGEIATGAARGTQGAPVRQWQGKQDGETEADYNRRALEWDAAKLSEAGAASWERWKLARGVLHYGFSWAIENGAGYADILNCPEMLRAVECLINDPPEIAAAFLRPNPNPTAQGGACGKDCREWILATFQEWVEDDYLKPTGEIAPDRGGRGRLPVVDFPEKGTVDYCDLRRARFDMFPQCFNLAVAVLRQTWGEFVTVCGLPDFDEMREWLERDRKDTGRGYVQMPALYESAFSEEQYFDLQTGETNAPKYGGGGIKAGALLLRFRDYLRERQGVDGCEPLPDRGAADRKPDAGEPIAGHIGTWAKEQGATAYYIGVSVCIRGTVCPLPPTNQKRGRVIAELIESENYLGAVKCDIHSAMRGDTSSAEYEKIRRFLERVNVGKRGKKADRKFSGCWHIKPAPVRQ